MFWSTKNIFIESYNEEECLIVAKEGFSGDSVSIEITKSDNLKISAPNINSYYRLVQFKYDFEDPAEFDIVKFIHALRCILVEFRTHGKDTLAKTADRIDNVTVGNSVIKRQVLNYLKHCNIIYESAHLYKIDEVKMQDKGINFNALSRMNSQQLKDAFADFCVWAQGNN